MNIKPDQIRIDVMNLLKKYYDFRSDEEIQNEINKVSTQIYGSLLKLPASTPRSFYKTAYEGMLNIIEHNLTDKSE